MEKSCYKIIVSKEGEVFLNTFPYDCCSECINTVHNELVKLICPCERKDRWKGYRRISNGTIAICTNYGKNKGFTADFDCLTASITTLCNTKSEILRYREEDSVKRIRRVLHNIRTINAHALLEIRGVIPESFFKQHIKEVFRDASDYIVNNSYKATHGILEIAKDLYSIKTEFSVYDKLIRGNVELDKKPFNIRDVLMTVIYPFFGDFTNKRVMINIQPYRRSVKLDFETIQIAFYHIIENTAKYVKPNTHISISFPCSEEMQSVVFEMTSLRIEDDETDSIFMENYSGKQAIKNKLQGEGIGFYRARKLIELNHGTLTVNAGQDVSIYENAEYASNSFIVSIPL